VNEPTIWHNCYSDNWNGVIVAEAFAHPAKFARGLIRRIYEHMRDSGYITPGDRVIDPFGGIAAGAVDAMSMGLHWYGCELEPRFVALGNANIDKWQRDLAMLGDRVGGAYLLQGDSRYLASLFGGGMGAAVSSPPFGEQQTGGGIGAALQGKGDYQITTHLPAANVGYANQADSPGNLAALPTGDFAAAVSSPPYADAVNGTGEGPGARHDPIHHNGDNAYKASSDSGYGSTPGNVGNMRDGGFEGVVSSPPFEASLAGGIPEVKGGGVYTSPRRDDGSTLGLGASSMGDYGSDPANIGNDTGDTFWAAARAIVEQTYAALRPGGYAAWVCKDFVRKGQRVPFSDQWQQLCAAVGFVPVERIAAMLVDDHGDQLDIFGGVTARRKERKSFFRRLAEKKGSPRIDHEDVIIMRKPVTE
jgi:hypothetical protein